jgi:hypothetical protein
MWIALRPFRYRGVKYLPGEKVPAESWPGRRALVSLRRIERVADPIPDPWETPYKSLKRAELNQFALERGVEDPENYPTRESLIAKLDELKPSPPVVTEEEPPVVNEPPVVISEGEGSEDDETGDEVGEEVDPFADLNDEDDDKPPAE